MIALRPRLLLLALIAGSLALAPHAMADDVCQQHADEFLSAIRDGNYYASAANFSGPSRLRFSPRRLRAMWRADVPADYGPLKSWNLVGGYSKPSAEVVLFSSEHRLFSLNFERATAAMVAEINFDPAGDIVNFFLIRQMGGADTSAHRLADRRVGEIVKAMAAGDFDSAEADFASETRSALTPVQLAREWKSQSQGGALESWKIAARFGNPGWEECVVVLRFDHHARAALLRVRFNSVDQVGELDLLKDSQ